MNRNLVTTLFKAVAFGMGTAVIVLNILEALTVETAISLLGIGLVSLALAALQKE